MPPGAPTLGMALGALALVVACLRRRRRDLVLWLALLFAAAGWSRAGFAHLRAEASLARAPAGERRVLFDTPVEADLRIVSRPWRGAREWAFDGTLHGVRRGRVRRATREPIRVFAAMPPPGLREGETARLWLTLRAPAEPDGPLLARLKHPDLVVERHAASRLASAAGGCRTWIAARLERGLRRGGAGDDARAVAAALALGERQGLGDATAEHLRRSGLSHLLAVSGMNVAVVIAAIGALARLAGLPPVALLIVHLVAGVGYALLLPTGSPVARAGLMALAPPVGRLIGRRGRGLELLGAAAVILVMADPHVWREPAFGLSFAVTAFLLRGCEPPDAGSPSRPRVAELGIRASVAAALGSLPLGMAYFGELTPGGALLNIVAVPVGAALLLVAVLAAAAAVLHPITAAPAALLLEPGVALLLGIADVIDNLPAGRVLVPPIAPWAAAAGLALLFVAMDRRRGALRRAGAAATGLIVLGAAMATDLRPLPRGEISIRMIDVGQGDALLLGLPDGDALLVDAGRPASGTRGAAIRALAAAGVRRLRAVVLSHDHLDHAGGLPGIVREIAVEEIWLPGLTPRSAALQEVLDEAAARGIPVRVLRAGDRLWRGGALIRCLHPARHGPRRGPNADSMVLMVEGPGGRLLLTGDLDGATEARLAAASRIDRVEVLKVPHHGSRDSASAALLDAARPRLALISVGRSNPWGHPHAETLGRLRQARIPVLSTARHGTLTIALGPGAPRLEFAAAFLDAPVEPP